MRFLNTKTYEIYEHQELPEDLWPTPPYAILSHTWLPNGPEGVREITYQDLKTSYLTLRHGGLKRHGWSKLVNYCDRAARDGWEWAWMDTCCIDKTNPADTEEAINAMFRWYQDAGICYAYLSDVELHDADDQEDITDQADDRLKALEHSFCISVWFTRGWTLQELLAPDYLVFVDQKWRHIGLRETWANEIETASRISPGQLKDFQSCSLAMKLSWASLRKTTREEDEAYSLLGLFGISMPLVYGEGRRAFIRFQQELIKTYDDESLFAWKSDHEDSLPTGILSPSIRYFKDSSRYQNIPPNPGFSMTNQGLHLTANIWKYRYNDLYAVEFNCSYYDADAEEPRRVGVYAQQVSSSNHYERTKCSQMLDLPLAEWTEMGRQTIIVRVSGETPNADSFARVLVLKCPKQITVDRSKDTNSKYYITMDEFRGSNDWLERQSNTLAEASDVVFLAPRAFLVIPISLQTNRRTLMFCIMLRSSPTFSYGILPRKATIYEAIQPFSAGKLSLMPMKARIGKYIIGIRLRPKPVNHRQRIKDLQLSESLTKMKEYELEVTLNKLQ